MTIEKLTAERLGDFLSFCKAHRADIDDSYLYDEDLQDFAVDGSNPTCVVLQEDNIVGTASVLNSGYYQRGRKGRFRIFHVLPECDNNLYARLLDRIRPDVPALDELYLFVRNDNARMRAVLESIGFGIERYAYFMVREPAPVLQPAWEDGYVLRPLVFGQDEADYCHVRNLGFAQLKGSQTPVTPDEVVQMKDRDDYIDSGIFLLSHRQEPVGVVRTALDIHDGEQVINIGPLALVPDYQGRGLGRKLLCAALSFGQSIGLAKSVLSANVDNENAVRLYLSEGFHTVEAVVCYSYRLPRLPLGGKPVFGTSVW